MPVQVPLTQGISCAIDSEDADLVLQHRWQLWERGPHRYARSHIRIGDRRRGTAMHRFILDAPPEKSVDHIDGDGLNNQRSNLRLVSKGQNRSNSIKRREASSEFKGVYKFGMKWASQISSRERWPSGPWRIGLFDTAVDAALAYDAVARILFGEYARVNFPRNGEHPAAIGEDA